MTLNRRTFLQQLILACASPGVLAGQGPASIDKLAEDYARKRHYNGVILAGKSSRRLYTRAFGVTDIATQTPITLHTRFESGSISKWIASVVVMHQVDRGVLSLYAPISTYLPNYRADNARRLTLVDLMSHRSGLPNDIITALRKDPAIASVPLPQAEAVRLYASGDLQNQPGTVWEYTHSNWILVKAILESATNRRYEDLAAELLWKPLGLRESGIFSGDSLAVPNMAQSYRRAPDGTLSVYPSILPAYFNMAGGFYTTAPDMLRLLDAVASGRVLSRSALGQLFVTRTPETHYCLGGRMRQRTLRGREEDVIWEDGSNKGFRMLAVRVRRTGETVILTSNASPDEQAMGDFADGVLRTLFL